MRGALPLYVREVRFRERSEMRRDVQIVLLSIAVGTGLAFLSGLIDVTPSGLVGATWFGFPEPWLRKLVIAPEYYPWREDWGNLALDVLAWTVLALVLSLSALALSRLTGKKTREH